MGPIKPHDVLPRGLVELTDRGVAGRLTSGYDADLLVVRGNPWRDPAALLDVERVYRAGVRVR